MLRLTDYLAEWARSTPDRPLYTFLNRAGHPIDSYTYASFHARTNGLARLLADAIKIDPGEPVLVVYPPGLELIAAFFACVKAGAIPVPVPPPAAAGFAAASERLALIVNHSGAKLALTDRSVVTVIASQRQATNTTPATIASVHHLGIDWIATNGLGEPAEHFEDRSQPLLFLQYTSGSTQEPRGVMVSHENIIANSRGVGRHQPIGVSWLPHFHDMGLIGYHLFPIIKGGSIFHFSPADFLRRPLLWLETISRVAATDTSAPNFAFEYCLRSDKIANDAIQNLDLSSLRVMMNASETVRPDIMERFLDRFAVAGLSPAALSTAYGLAENTLCATTGGRAHLRVNRRSLQHNKLRLAGNDLDAHDAVLIASCGKPADGVEIRIVAPETGTTAAADQVGEIWLAGKSKAMGYWNRPDLTAEVFQVRLDGSCTEFLRTGDLGFMHGDELYICGRLKDMIVVRGANVYPTDIETLVDQSLPPLHHGKVAVFGFGAIEEEDTGIVVLVEAAAARAIVNLPALHRTLNAHLHVPILTLACVPRNSLPCTSSGKIARHKCCDLWRAGAMAVLQRLDPAVLDEDQPDLAIYIERLLEQSGGDPELPIGDAGLDSLEVVKLTLEIERLVTENMGPGWVTESLFDLRTLQSMSLGRLQQMIKDIQARRLSGFSAALFYRQTLQSVSERDAGAMRADAVLPAEIGAEKRPATPLGKTEEPVLLTGATGFLGSHLLDALLRTTNRKIVVIARGSDSEHAGQRVGAALARARGRNDKAAALDPRVEIRSGNLAMPRLGLSEADWTTLAERLGAVFHCGAEVDYVKTYARLRGPNVLGTRAIIDLCAQGSAKTLHHISTTFIFGWTTQLRAGEDDFNVAMRGLDFGYIQSKWVAEQLVAAAGARGIDARIYRPSLVTASRREDYVREDILVRMLSYMIRHRLSCNASNQISLLPVDVCAQNIASLALLDRPDARTFHLTTDKYYTLQTACQCIAERHGYSFEYVDAKTFVDHMSRHCGPDDVLFPLLAFFQTNRHKIEVMRDKRYDNSNYQAARAQSEQIAPEPGLADIMDSVVGFLRREGLIPNAIPVRETFQAVSN
jgi:thioester reductase-like protein